MTSLPSSTAFHVFNSKNIPVRETQVIIQTLAHEPYILGLTDKNGFVRITFNSPVKKPKGKIIIKGRVVYYGPLDIKGVTLN